MKKHTSGWVEMKAAAVNVGTVGTESRRDQLVSSVLYQAVVGLDVSDRQTHYCVLDLQGEVAVEGVVATKETSLRVQFEGKARMRIALEAGTHSAWISRLLAELGHEVIVANPRNLRMISENDCKNDPADARLLAAWLTWARSCCRPSSTAPRKHKMTWRWYGPARWRCKPERRSSMRCAG